MADGGGATLLPSTNATLLSASCPGHRCTATTPPLQREIEKQRNATKMHGWRLHCVQLSGAGRDPIETLAAIEANKIHANV